MQEKSSAATYTDAQRQYEVENCTDAMGATKAGDYERARARCEVLAGTRNLTATLSLVRQHLKSLVAPSDPAYVIALLAEASASGMPGARDDPGQIYEAGTWRAQTSTNAFEFYRLPADQGGTNCAFNFGSRFLHAIGSP